MTTFYVPDMSCGHCTRAIEQAIRKADSNAEVTCALDTHLVKITSSLPAERLAAAMGAVGYPATQAV